MPTGVRNDCEEAAMINGAHLIIFAHDADATRAFFRDMLGMASVDVGGGWLIFALPPAELAAHPTDGPVSQELYLMCDDIDATVAELRGKGVEFSGEIGERDWGRLVEMKLPGAGTLQLYEPRHPSPPHEVRP
jgi:catechol 2,3-dioxygenase-like lactoylglutathione lyase family enzyme